MKKFAKILGFLGFFVTVATVQIGTAWGVSVECQPGYYLPRGETTCVQCPSAAENGGIGVFCPGNVGDPYVAPADHDNGIYPCKDQKECSPDYTYDLTPAMATSRDQCKSRCNSAECIHPNSLCPLPNDGECQYQEDNAISGYITCGGTCTAENISDNYCKVECPTSCNNGRCTCPNNDCTGFDEVNNLPGVHYCRTDANSCDVTHLIQGENTIYAQIISANNYQCSAYGDCKIACSHEGNPTCLYPGTTCEWDLNTPVQEGYQQGDDCINPVNNQPIEPFNCDIIVTGCTDPCQYWDGKECKTYSSTTTYKCGSNTVAGPIDAICGVPYTINRRTDGGSTQIIDTSSCTPSGYRLQGWRLTIDYSPYDQQLFSDPEVPAYNRFDWQATTNNPATFVAEWEEDKLYIHYHRYDGDWVQENPPADDKEAFTISQLPLTKTWTLTRDNSTFRGWCDDLYYTHLSNTTWLNTHCHSPYTIPADTTSDVHLYAWWECTGPYTLNSSYQCEGDKINVKYTCHAPENSSYNDTSYTYTDAATYGQQYGPVKSVEEVTTASNSAACQFAGYEIDPDQANTYEWTLLGSTSNSPTNGKYRPGSTMDEWEHINPTPETEIEFELKSDVWKAETYLVEYHCGTINNTQVQGGHVTDSVTYNAPYFVANDNILADFLERCDETLGGNVSGYTLQDWAFTCDNQPYGSFNTGDPIANPNAWTYDSNNCYFTANWAQTDFVITLDSNIDQNPMNDGSDVSDPEELYTRLNDKVCSCPERTNSCEMGSLTAIPTKVVTVTLNGNGGQFTWNNETVSVATDDSKFTFLGFYELEESNSDQYIYGEDDANSGLITNRGKEVGIGYDGTSAPYTWYAHWENRDAVILPEPIERPGFTFNGWLCDHESVGGVDMGYYNNGTPYSYGISFLPTDNAICTAQWTEACYEVSFNDNGGTPSSNGTHQPYYKKHNDNKWYTNATCASVDYGPTVANNMPSKEHATFTGYYDETQNPDLKIFAGTNDTPQGGLTSDGTTWTVSDNATLYAQYECDEPYHLDTDSESATYGQCVACDPGFFYDPTELNPAKQCKNCNEYIHDHGASGSSAYTWTSKDPYNWSINQCYRVCDNKTCDEFSLSETDQNNRLEQFLEGAQMGKQISFYGNEFATNGAFNTCSDSTDVRYCPVGLLSNASILSMKPIAAPVDFHIDPINSPNETKSVYIVGGRVPSMAQGLKLQNGFAWTQVSGPGQNSPDVNHIVNGQNVTFNYIHIIYPATAPRVSLPENYTFTGYGYPQNDPVVVTREYNLLTDDAVSIVSYANSSAHNDMSPRVGTGYTRNLWPIYTDNPTYTLTYSCGDGGGTPPAPRSGIYAGNNVDISEPSGCSHYNTHSLTEWAVTATDDGQNLGTVPAGTTSFTWDYDQDVTFTAVWGNANTHRIIYNKIPTTDGNNITSNGNTLVRPNADTMPTQFECNNESTPIIGQPQLKNSDGNVIGEVKQWCDDNGLNSGCMLPKYLQNTVCTDKNVYAKWECTDTRYHLNEDRNDCVVCNAGEYWDEDDEVCKSCSALGNGWTSKPGYNQSIDQCYRICDGSNETISTSCTSPDGLSYTGFSVSPIVNGETHQIEFYGNWRNRDNNPELDVCGANAASVTYCARIIRAPLSTHNADRLMSSKVIFKKKDNIEDAGNRHLVGYTPAVPENLSAISFVTGKGKIWSHIMGPGQYTTGSDGRQYVYAIYPTDTAPEPSVNAASDPLFKGYFDGTGSDATQRVAAALGLDSSNAVAFPQTSLSENQIGDRILYPQYCENGQEWDPDAGACIAQAQVYDVKYVCGEHGTDAIESEMTNRATSGQSYTVAVLDGGVFAACTANTGYVLKTNNSGQPLWYFNGDSSANHYTNEVINQWNFTIPSPQFTAQYDCAAGYTLQDDECKPGTNLCNADFLSGAEPHANISNIEYVNGQCVYKIQCAPCGDGTYGCYDHEGDQLFDITLDPSILVLPNTSFCTPKEYSISYNDTQRTLHFNVDTGTCSPTSYLYGNTINIDCRLDAPNDSHAVFKGWCTGTTASAGCAETQSISATDYGDKTYYAWWDCDQNYHQNGLTCDPDGNLPLIYKPNGGQPNEDYTVLLSYGQEFSTEGAIYTKTGNILARWDVAAGGASTFNSHFDDTTNTYYAELGENYSNGYLDTTTTLNAHWEACQCDIGTGVASCNANVVTENACAPEVTCQTGYTNPHIECTGIYNTICRVTCDAEGQYEIILDKNFVVNNSYGPHGSNGQTPLYTIHNTGVYSDQSRIPNTEMTTTSNPLSTLPQKYYKVTFNHCDGNDQILCSDAATEVVNANIEFSGFYRYANGGDTYIGYNENLAGWYITEDGIVAGKGYSGEPSNYKWYAGWNTAYGMLFANNWPQNPTRDGYTFVGWYTDPVNGTPVNVGSGYLAYSDTIVYAHWERTSCPDDEILIGTDCKKKCLVDCTWNGQPTNPTTCPSDIADIPHVQNCRYDPDSPAAQEGYRPYDGSTQCFDRTTNQQITPESCNYTVNCEYPRIWDPDTSSCVYPSDTKWKIKFVCDTNNLVVQEYEKSVGENMELIPLNTSCVKPGYSFTQWKDAEHNNDTLTAGASNVQWTHEYNATYTPDWNDGNVYHVNLHAYSCDDPTNPDLTGTFNSYTGVQELWEKYNVAWYKNAGLNDQITTLNGSQLPTLSGWKFGGYNRTDGVSRLSCDNGTCENLSPTLIRDNEDWCAVWSKCNANEYWNNGDCISCSTATGGQYPHAAMGATSINDCYNRPCYLDCQPNFSACNIPHAETYTYVNESFIGSMYFPNTNSSACQLDIWLPETSGTVPNCQCRVATCETGYHPNNDNTACVPNSWTVNYYCGDSNAHNGSASGMTMWNTATYGQDYKVAYDTQNTNTQIADCNVRNGYILNNWKLNNSVGSTYPTGWSFPWLYEFSSTIPTFTAQYVCDTDNGYHLINGTCQQCPENSYWTTENQCKQCDPGYHVNDAGNGCTANTINLVYSTSCGTSSPSSTTCTFDRGFNLATHSANTGYTFNGWTTNGNTYTGPFNPGQQIQCTAAYLGNAVYTDGETVIITGSCASNDELCPAQLPASNSHATLVSGVPNSGGTQCIYTLKCEACTNCDNNDYSCYTNGYSATNGGEFTVIGSIGDANALTNAGCTPTEYDVYYRCDSNGQGTISSTKAIYGQPYTVEYNGDTIPCTQSGLLFSGWRFNGEPNNPPYVGGSQISPWNYCDLNRPIFTAYYSPCSEDQIYVPCLGECRPKCSKPCTWPGAGTDTNPSQCPTGYPTGTSCWYDTNSHPANGYIPVEDLTACYSTSSCSDLTPNQCQVDGDPICPDPDHYTWNPNTRKCEPNIYSVTLDKNGGIQGPAFVGKLYEQYGYGWSTTNSDFTPDLLLAPNELPMSSEECKVFVGYFTASSGGFQRIQQNGFVSQNGFNPLPANTLTSNNVRWYAHYDYDHSREYTIKFRCPNGGEYSTTVHMGDTNLLAPLATMCSGVAFNQWKGSAHPEILLDAGSYFAWDRCFDEVFVPDTKAVHHVYLNENGGMFPSNEYQELWYAVDMGWYKNDGLAPADRITFIPGDQLPIKTNSNFNGWLDNATQQPRGNFSGTNWNLPNSISANETWDAQWGPCNPNEYWDGGVCKNCSDQTSGAFPYAVPGATSIGQCYNTCDEQCKWNSSIAASCNIPHATQYAPVAATYSGQHFWGYNYCSLNDWSSPHPAQAIPACQCRVTECEAGWSVDSISNSCIENAHWPITLNPHLVNNTQGSYSSPRVLYTWHGKGVYLYDDYSQYLMNGNQNPLVSNPRTYATVTFNLNGDGAWLDWENQRYTDPVDIDVPLTYLGFYKSETDSDMVINTNRYIEPAGTQAGKTATANLEWHAHWQSRQISTVTGPQLPQPSRPGFNFVGWFNTSGTQIYATTPVAQNMTVYARWSDKIYTVKLVSDRNNCQPSNNTPTELYEKYNVGWNRYTTGTFDRDLLLNDDELPTPNAGYEFKGYYDTLSGDTRVIRSDGRVEQEPNYTDDNHTWYARCGRPTGPFTVTFKCDTDGHVVQSGSVNHGANVTAPTVAEANCIKPGHTFNKWKAVVNNENVVFDAGGMYSWGYYSGADFVPQWVLDAPYHVILDQDGATQPGVTDLYEKYGLWWSLYQNGNSTITQLSGNTLPRKTGFNFGGYENANGVTMGTYSSTTGVWTLPLNTTVTGDETWTAIWSECGIGEYWNGYKCYPCPGEFTDNPHAIGIEQCYKECTWSCTQNGCPGTQPAGMSGCGYENVTGMGIQYNVPGATCQLQGQPDFPQNSCQACTDCCPMNITCDKGYDLVGCGCRDNRYTITLDSDLYNGNGTRANPSTLHTWFNHGVYRDYNRTLMMTPDENPLASGTPSTFAMVTLNGNGVEFNWHNQYGSQLQDNVDFVFDGFYDTTGAAIDPVIGIDRHITEAGQSIGTTAQNNQTWRARWLDGSVDLPSISRDGYTFDGWWTECNGGTRVSMGNQTITVPRDLTLCAHWKNASYTAYYNCGEGNPNGNYPDTTQNPTLGNSYNVLANGMVPNGNSFITCSRQGDTNTNTPAGEFSEWKANGLLYQPGIITWNVAGDQTFTAQYRNCVAGQYYTNNHCVDCPTVPDGETSYTSDPITAISQNNCYRTCPIECNRVCPNEDGVLGCVEYTDAPSSGTQYYGNSECVGEAQDCKYYKIMCKPGYTPDYYLSTDTGTHCTKLADHEITLAANCGQGTVIPGDQEKLYTTENTGVYLNPARTNAYEMRANRNPLVAEDLPRCIVTATFNHCDNNDPNCDGATIEQKTVDLGFNGYYKAETNGTRYTDKRQEDGQLKSYITQQGIDAGKGYTANATWFAQWLDGQVGSQKWPSVPTRIGTCGVTYEFVDWYTAANGGNVVSPDTQVSEDVTWYAHWCESCPTGTIANGSCIETSCKATFTCNDGYAWDERQCQCVAATGLTLTYDLAGGTASVPTTYTMTFEQSFTTLGDNDVTKPDQVNCEWVTTNDGGGSFPLLDHLYTYNVNSDTTLQAHWVNCRCNPGNGVANCSMSVVNNACFPAFECKDRFVTNDFQVYTCTDDCNPTCTVNCTECLEGWISNENHSQCIQCEAGTYQVGNECKPCPEGFTSNAGATSCYGNTITINWDENGGNLIDNGSCQYCINDNSQPAWAQCNSADNNLTLANVTHSNPAMQFLGWKLFSGDDRYPIGTNVMCTYDNVGVYSGTSTKIQAQWNKCQCNYSDEDHVQSCQPINISGICMCFAKCMPGYELIDETGTCNPSCIPETYSEGITYKPNGGTPNRNYTQSVAYNATFTTFDWSVEHYTKAHHILAGWAVESGGVGTFDGTAALNTTYTYRTDGPTSLLAKWTECANDEISFSTDNQCHQCTCDAPNCNTYATDENKCACDATCPTGYTYGGCNCNGTVCKPICNKKQSDAIYECGDGATGSAPATQTMNYGDTHTVQSPFQPQGNCSKPNHTFMTWLFSGDGNYHNPGDAIVWNYTEDKTFTGQWCENCGFVANGSCELGNDFAGSCQYTCSCEPGYILDGGVCTAHPVCKPDSSLTVTYQPNGGVNNGVLGQPVIQNVTYGVGFITKPGTIFTKENSIITAWDHVEGGDYPNLNYWYVYDTDIDTKLDAHWEQCTCTTGNGVSSCTTSSTSENACACAGECDARYINGGCSCNGTSTCTQTCTECPAGYISNADQTECVICPENTYQSGNTCEQCPTGYTSPAGSTSIEDCYNNPISYTVHYSSNNGLDQTETQPVVYGTTFTTLGGTTFTYDNHIMTRWNKISGGDYTELLHPYEYGVQEDTFLKAQWAECTCATGNGVSSCTTSSTSENACTCTGECAAGYVKGECSCSGNTCTQSCTKCADNQVEINGVCVDCSCSADGDGVVSGCGFVSNENNVCHWGPTTCGTGYGNPGDLSCDDSVHNNNCRAICSQIQSNAIYNCGTGTGIPPVSELVSYGTPYTIKANATVYGCSRENSTFAGWEFDGDQQIHAAGDTVTWNFTTDKNFRAVYCYNCPTIAHGTCELEMPTAGQCDWNITCDMGYKLNETKDNCVPISVTLEYQSNGGTPVAGYTYEYAMSYGDGFRTLDGGAFEKSRHIFNEWQTVGLGGSFPKLNWDYTYNYAGNTTLQPNWTLCPDNTISLNNQCQQCQCTENEGVTSCTTSATNDDTCSCTGECAAGYEKGECNCNEITCTQSCSKCAYDQVSVNGHCTDCECNVNDDSGATSCGTKSVIDNMCNWGPATCRPGYAYPTIICDGSNNQLCEASCTICPAGTYQDGEVCTSCPTCQTSLPGATSVNECFTDSTCCAPDEHIEHGECTPNVRRCSIPDATNAVRIWNPAIGTYGPCTVEVDGCNSGYHVSGNVCVKDTEACTVEHGHGERDWNGTSWGACGDVVCDPGYEPNSDYTACVECSNRRVNGDIAVSGYIYECEIAACMYQGQKYALQDGECVPICENASDETGTKVWDERTKKCIRTCKPGYKMW